MRAYLSIALSLLVALAACGAPKHPNVTAIGERDPNAHTRLPNLYSLESEVQIGEQAAAEVRRQAKMVRDPLIAGMVARVGQRIIDYSDWGEIATGQPRDKIPFHFEAIDSKEVNAFALPGGYIFVNTGLIAAAEDEAELAGVLAHEAAHVIARHATERATDVQLLNLAAIPLVFVGGVGGDVVRTAAGFAINLSALGITRDSEREADALAIQYMWNAAYRPANYPEFFRRMLSERKRDPSRVEVFFSTHPPFGERIELVEREIAQLPPNRLSEAVKRGIPMTTNTSEFVRAKRQIEVK